MINLFDLPIQLGYDKTICDQYLEADSFAFDIETDAGDFHWASGERGTSYCADVIMISLYSPNLPILVLKANFLGKENYEANYFNKEDIKYGTYNYWLKERTKNKQKYWAHEILQMNKWGWDDQIRVFIETFFQSHRKRTAIAHYAVFDARGIYGQFDLAIPKQTTFWDNLTIGYTKGLIDPNESSKADLYTLTKHHLDEPSQTWWAEMKGYRSKLADVLSGDDTGKTLDEVVLYSAADSIMAYKLYEEQAAASFFGVDNENLQPVYRTYMQDEFPKLLQYDLEYTRWCIETAVRGILLDRDYTKQKAEEFLELFLQGIEAIGLKREQFNYVEKESWLAWYFYGEGAERYADTPSLHLSKPSEEVCAAFPDLLTKKGNLSFSKKAMDYYIVESKIVELEPFKEAMRYHAAWMKCDELLRHSERDGRIHVLLARTAVTGRNRAQSPNLQNMDFDFLVGLLIADPGYVFCELDLSNAENYMMSNIGRDNAFAAACCEDDYHSATMKIWGVDDRATAKNLNFAVSYGQGVRATAVKLKKTITFAKEKFENRKKAFPQLANTQKNMLEPWGQRSGYVPLWTGRRVRLRSYKDIIKVFTALNSCAQGGISEIITRAIVDGEKNSPYQSFIALQVHDSLIAAIKIEEYVQAIMYWIEVLATQMPQELLTRTTPHTRWLVDHCNRSNKEKWGYVHGQEYPFPDEYINRWGVHQYPPDKKKAPVWINAFGYGEEALRKELNQEKPPDPQPLPAIGGKVREKFDWGVLQRSVDSVEKLFRPIESNGQMFSFAEGMNVIQEMTHKGHQTNYLTYLEFCDKLSEVMEQYKIWRSK